MISICSPAIGCAVGTDTARGTHPKKEITMHQLAPRITFASFDNDHAPVHKKIVEDRDLQVIATTVCESLRQGLYLDLIAERKRSDVLQFLRRLTSKCELQYFDSERK